MGDAVSETVSPDKITYPLLHECMAWCDERQIEYALWVYKLVICHWPTEIEVIRIPSMNRSICQYWTNSIVVGDHQGRILSYGHVKNYSVSNILK